MSNTHAPAAAHPRSHSRNHTVPIWALFLMLLFFTAAEVGLYEAWKHSAQNNPEPFMPKVAMVLIVLLVLTLPKAGIVLIWFMHLKFEKQMIIALALIPFGMAGIVVLPMLTDAKALKRRAYNFPDKPIGVYHTAHEEGSGHGDAAGGDAAHAQPAPATGGDDY